MRKIVLYCIAVILLGPMYGSRPALAQEESTKNTQASAKVQPVQPYRLDFSFNELMDGKVVNARHYSMNLNAGGSNEIKIGTRVPVSTATRSDVSGSVYQYMDVGTSIFARLTQQGDEMVLAVRGEVSNLDTTSGTGHGIELPPVVRQIKISGDTLLVLGKPIVIGSMDDPNSKRQFQLEVTVTKLR